MLVSNFIFQPAVLLRRSALERIGLYIQPEGLLAEDYATNLAMALEGEFRYLDLPLGFYRTHMTQMTNIHILKMARPAFNYVKEFFAGLDPQIQQRTGWTEATLAEVLEQRLNNIYDNSYFELGRRKLLLRDWNGARQQFGDGLRRANAKNKAKACLGLACSLLHVNLERVLRLSGRVALR